MRLFNLWCRVVSTIVSNMYILNLSIEILPDERYKWDWRWDSAKIPILLQFTIVFFFLLYTRWSLVLSHSFAVLAIAANRIHVYIQIVCIKCCLLDCSLTTPHLNRCVDVFVFTLNARTETREKGKSEWDGKRHWQTKTGWARMTNEEENKNTHSQLHT